MLWGLVLWSGVSACPAPPYYVTTSPEEPGKQPDPSPPLDDECEEATFGSEGGTLDRGEAVLSVLPGMVAEGTVLELCRTAAQPGRYEALSSGWQVELEAGTLRGWLELTLRLADTESAALMLSGDSEPVRSILAQETATGELTTRLYGPAVVTAIHDERVLLSYAPRPAAADVLFVVDNSCSNLDDQFLLRNEVLVLLDRLQANGVDYHIGVISTDSEDPEQQGKLAEVDGQRWVEPSTPEGEVLLDRLLDRGNQGTADEQGLATTLSALTVHAYGVNAGFLREGAALSIVVMSDKDDQGTTDPQSLVEVLQEQQQVRPVVEFHGLINAEVSQRYLVVTEQIGGVTADIDGAGWDLFLARVGDRLAFEAAMELPRERWPEVWLLPDGDEQPLLAPESSWEWLAERRVLWLTRPAPEGWTLQVLAAP
jgi:hypothetical protein